MQQGNANRVKIVPGMGADPVDVEIEPGMTIRQALQKAGMQVPSAKDIRVNSQPASLEYSLMPNDLVSFLPKIEGGVR